ncbi:MAG TPA: CBS domain-containing protein [Candidatus Limnocylindrales bacterium]|jgi:predicted transcriptional regulator
MLCPVCRHDNFEGEDVCANCGADLAASDVPQPALEFHDTVLGEHLASLGVGEPSIVAPGIEVSEAVRRMHDAATDCLLICEGDRLVGIFTDRDAVLKVAGTTLGSSAVGEVMTHDPVVLRPEDTLAVAIHKMAVGGFRHIPVVDATGRPQAVVSAADVFRHLATALG